MTHKIFTRVRHLGFGGQRNKQSTILNPLPEKFTMQTEYSPIEIWNT